MVFSSVFAKYVCNRAMDYFDGTEKTVNTYVTTRRVCMRIRAKMPSLSGATKILNRGIMDQEQATATLVYFWSMSCSQCTQSIKNLKELENVFKDRLAIHAIHMPREELDYSKTLVKEKIEQLGIIYPIYLDNELKISDRFGNNYVPSYYLFDQQQQLRFFKAGYLTFKLLEQKIDRII